MKGEKMTEQNITDESNDQVVDTDSVIEEAITESGNSADEESGTRSGGESGPEDDPETIPREYVQKLRAESAENRVKAKRADDLAQRLHTHLVAATGRLQDATDLPFEESHLDDPEALETAIANLLEAKPHLASRRVSGDIGQGVGGPTESTVNLAGLLRGNL